MVVSECMASKANYIANLVFYHVETSEFPPKQLKTMLTKQLVSPDVKYASMAGTPRKHIDIFTTIGDVCK